MVPVTFCPRGAEPASTTELGAPTGEASNAPTTAPPVTLTGVALATCAELSERSNTVSQRCVAFAGPGGRTSSRQILFHVFGSGAIWSVSVVVLLAGNTVVTDPEKLPKVTS